MSLKTTGILGLLMTAALICQGWTAETATAKATKIRTVEGITEYELANGLRVLLLPDPSRPTVTVNLTIMVGSRHEGYGEAGMAHLLEHMVFKGTPLHPNVPKVLQDRGAKFNGTTSLDRTNYYETLPASDENLEFAIRLEADRMINSFIKGEDLASEMTVVRNEFERGENQPLGVLRKRIAAAAFEWHNYGKTTIGNRSDIERVPINKLRDFYRRYYQPDNAFLIVAGKFDETKALTYINKYFGTIPRPSRKLDNTYTIEPAQDGQRSVELRRVGEVGAVAAAYHVPSGAHGDYAPLSVLANILTSAPSGRLYKNLVESQKATQVFAFARGSHDPGLFWVFASVPDGKNLNEVRDIILANVESVEKDGVTETEVERAKRKILKQWELAQADTSSIAVELSNWVSQGDWRLYFLYRDRIEAVTPADVTRVASEYLARSNRTLGVYIPSKEPERVAVPGTPDIEALLADFKGREAKAEVAAFDTSPAAIEAKTIRTTLPSGMKLAMLPKETRGNAVQLQITLRFGDAKSLVGYDAAAELLPVLMTRGTKQLDRAQLEDRLDQLQAQLAGSGSPYGLANFSVETKRDTLLDVIGLLKQVLREPALSESEFQILRNRQIAAIAQVRTQPHVLASNRLSQILSPYPANSVRYVPTFDESEKRYKELTNDKIATLYREFLGAQAGEIIVVGDFDPEEIQPALADLGEGWNSKRRFERVPSELFNVAGESLAIETPDKANAQYSAGLTVGMRDDNQDYPALLIGNFIFGGGSLSSRLGNRVRQQEGLSYGVSSRFSAHPIDRVASFRISAISNPQNTPKVVAVIQEELELLLKKGITEEELEQAKQGYLQRQRVSRANDSVLASILSSNLYVDRTMAYYADREAQIQSLTTTDVVNALRTYIKPERLVIITAGDFEKLKTESAKAIEK